MKKINPINVIKKINFKNYSNLSEYQLEQLDNKAIQSESKNLHSWSNEEIANWVGYWFNQSLFYNPKREENGFTEWLFNYEIKLINTCKCSKTSINKLIKFAEKLDKSFTKTPSVKKDIDNSKKFILKMVELCGFNSLLCIGI